MDLVVIFFKVNGTDQTFFYMTVNMKPMWAILFAFYTPGGFFMMMKGAKRR